MVQLSSFGRAKAMLALLPFSKNAQVIFDPNVILSVDDAPAGTGKFDSDTGVTKYTPDPATPDDQVGPYMVYGNMFANDLGRPISADDNINGRDYLIRPTLKLVFEENVGALDAQYALLKSKGAAHHPLGNRGIKPGDNLVAFGDFPAGEEVTNNVVALTWSSKPYNQRQESSASA